MQEISSVEHTGTLTIYRASEVSSKIFFGMASKMVKFGNVVSRQEYDRFLELNAKFEEVLKAYEERGKKIQSLKNKVSQIEKQLGKRKVGESSRERIVYP